MPTSAHPPTTIEGIIYSLMRTYHRQNTYQRDYHAMAIKLFNRHVARGWSKSYIKELILSSDQRIRNPKPTPTEAPLSNKEELYFHMEFHPADIPKHQVRTIYNQTCGDVLSKRLGIKKFTIAYSRPKNIRDKLTKAKFYQAPGQDTTKFYSGELATT